MKTVTVHKLDEEGNDVLVGRIALSDAGVVSALPSDNVFLEHLIATTELNGGRTSVKDPEGWLKGLCEYYKSPYLRVSRVEGG